MSMWSDYCKELGLWTHEEFEWGFVMYEEHKDRLHIMNVYIDPKFRMGENKMAFRNIWEIIYKRSVEKGFKYVTLCVDMRADKAETRMYSYLRGHWKFAWASGYEIILQRSIPEDAVSDFLGKKEK
jgi:hypothetical protein